MQYFNHTHELRELKSSYRKLAAKHHPDRGGCAKKMQHINLEYQHYLGLLKKAKLESHTTRQEKPSPATGFNGHTSRAQAYQAYSDRPQQRTRPRQHPYERAAQHGRSRSRFDKLEKGDTIYVNGTECEVIEISAQQFRVVAKGRNRQAVFDRQTGVGLFNPKLQASRYWNGQVKACA